MPESLAQKSARDLVGIAICVAAEAIALYSAPDGRRQAAILTALREVRDGLASVRLTASAVEAIDSAAFDRAAAARDARARGLPDGTPALRLVHSRQVTPCYRTGTGPVTPAGEERPQRVEHA